MGTSFTAFTVKVNVSSSTALPWASFTVTVISAEPFCSSCTSKVNVPDVPSSNVAAVTTTRLESPLTALNVNV